MMRDLLRHHGLHHPKKNAGWVGTISVRTDAWHLIGTMNDFPTTALHLRKSFFKIFDFEGIYNRLW